MTFELLKKKSNLMIQLSFQGRKINYITKHKIINSIDIRSN